MARQPKEHLQKKPPITYKYSTEILSLSLGQGTSEFVPTPPISLVGAIDHLGDFPNDKVMLLQIPQPKPEDVPDLLRRFKEKPSPVLMKCLVPFLGSNNFPDAKQAVLEFEGQAFARYPILQSTSVKVS